MPIYEFENIKTGERFTRMMRISAKEEYLKDNPDIKSVISSLNIVSGTGGVVGKADNGFTDVLNKIKSNCGEGHTINTKR